VKKHGSESQNRVVVKKDKYCGIAGPADIYFEAFDDYVKIIPQRASI